MEKTTGRAFVEKAEAFIKDFEKKLKEKLNPYQKKHTKIRVDFDPNFVDKEDLDNSCISIDIFFFSHGRHQTEDRYIYFIKRGFSFIVNKQKDQINLKNLTLCPIVYFLEEGILTNYPNEAKKFKLNKIGSENVISAITEWINYSKLDFNVFFENK
ncbi:MAG: hypothetical protein QG630_267 [Patescibacteria group bacterium]|nr:hypothetical protein [Patescibacteria group bacterium]